jgi:hypothetical protein
VIAMCGPSPQPSPRKRGEGAGFGAPACLTGDVLKQIYGGEGWLQ